MIPFILAFQISPGYAFPTALLVSKYEQTSGQVVRTFGSRDDDLEFVQTDSFSGQVTGIDPSTARSTWIWRFRPVSQRLDGQLIQSSANAPPFEFTEVRSRTGAQFRFSTALDEDQGQEVVSRFYTVPLPSKPIGLGDTWDFSDSRDMPYTFRGRVVGFEGGRYQVRTFFQSTQSPKFTANGTAWIGKNGLPSRIELSTSSIRIPGSEGQMATLNLTLVATDK